MADFTLVTSDEELPTRTSVEQDQTELACREVFEDWLDVNGSLARESCVLTSLRARMRTLECGEGI